ncbi:hypothetical protein H4R26_002814 [Coemansia thaxteri]|uniref:Sld7 C-terminal domain-containing protein n=1 Tax=Coemansia thaxteri TaxID=2663907 RepID=A0A9W8BJZ7_9FUNG|nr:hypothetical protein H4R26_002814 [Coemansia thaxteri]KAJ2480665.1 hypothetical protein EV174_003664 [Coemansia sp. RSA 2320]
MSGHSSAALGAAASSRSRVAWRANLACPPPFPAAATDPAFDAVVLLVLEDAVAPCKQQLPGGGRLHLLKHVRLDSIPPVLVTATMFSLYINAKTPESQRYVNGVVGLLARTPGLLPEHTVAVANNTAILARVETRLATRLLSSSAVAALDDPFADAEPCAPVTQLRSDPYALVYLSALSGAREPRLVLQLLACPQSLEPLASVTVRPPSTGLSDSAQLETEHRFIELLTAQRNERARIQRTQSTESIMKATTARLTRHGAAGGGGEASSAGARRISKNMTLSDIEHLALAPDSQPGSGRVIKSPKEELAPSPSPEIEQKNKKIAKQLIISSLKERGIGRDHPDFAALWGQIYHSLKFALRVKIARRLFAPRELKQESDKHANFYCTPT